MKSFLIEHRDIFILDRRGKCSKVRTIIQVSMTWVNIKVCDFSANFLDFVGQLKRIQDIKSPMNIEWNDANFRISDKSYQRQLILRTSRTQGNSYPRQLVLRTTRTKDNSYTQDKSYLKQFVTKTTRSRLVNRCKTSEYDYWYMFLLIT